MLEGVVVVLHIVVVVVGVGDKVAVSGKDICSRDIGLWQSERLRALYLIHLLRVVAQVSPELVTQVGVGALFTHHLDGRIHAHCAVVGSEYHAESLFGNSLENLDSSRVAEPRLSEGAVGSI